MPHFGATSLANMAGMHPDLIRVNNRAIIITAQDFGVTCGIRSDAAQLDAWLHHFSKLNGIPVGQTVKGIKGTGRGNHQIDAHDHTGHATDNTPFINGVILWSAVPPEQQWKYIYPVASAMRDAAIIEAVKLRWGGVWDRTLNDLPAGAAAMQAEVAAYTVRHKGPDFIDGPHFELLAA